MQISHQLVPKLKNLRLSGILATLEVRTQQAIEEKLSYVEFLQRLLEDEVERRAQKQLDLRLRRASFDLEKTLEGSTSPSTSPSTASRSSTSPPLASSSATSRSSSRDPPASARAISLRRSVTKPAA